MSIVAALDKVLFFNASSKYSVLRMKTEDSSVPTEARSPYRYHDHLIRFTAVGIELPQTDTVKIEMDGEWKDGKYGLQLQVDHWQEIVPPTLEGVRNYLASGLLKGIGEKTADAIIEKFGVNALEILEHQPDRLLEIRGITKERLAEIKDAYAETSRMRILMTLLAPFKVTPTTAQKIYQHFGPACADIVRQSPFNLCQVPGFGFKRIDAIVQKSGGDLRDPKRVHGALFYALEDARTKDGHLYLEAEALLKAAMQLLNERIPLPQMRVPMSQVEQELSAMIRQDEVVSNHGNVYLPKQFLQESETAQKAVELRWDHLEDKLHHMAEVKAYAVEKLTAIPDLQIIGSGKAPHVLSVSMAGWPSQNVVNDLGSQGICVSAGSACHHGKSSQVVSALGLPKRVAAGVIRLSFGPETTFAEIDACAEALRNHHDHRMPML